MKTFMIHSMGCKSNQFEGRIIAENLVKHGMTEVNTPEEAELYIMNSCSVTQTSDKEAFATLRNVKRKNPRLITVLTGCTAQIGKETLLDCADYIIGNDEKLELFESINKLKIDQKRCLTCDIDTIKHFNEAFLTHTGKTRACLKIQDGCDNRCTYCIIPFARGKSRSADTDFIINQIKSFEQTGYKEVVFTGIHIGLWGKEHGKSLLELLKEVETRTDIPRYRLGSLNPHEITDDLLDFLSKSDRFCPHFHLSLQSACDKTLRSMNRFYAAEDCITLTDKINCLFDNPFLGSDVIAGFAGETEADFEITCRNLQRAGLSQIHTFPYSVREGTAGAALENQVPEPEKKRRASVIKAISAQKHEAFVQVNLGKIREVLVQKEVENGLYKGLTRNYLTVYIKSDMKIHNTLQRVKLVNLTDGKLFGAAVPLWTGVGDCYERA